MRTINYHQRIFKEEAESKREALGKRPDWLKVRLPIGENFSDLKNLMRDKNLNTVCEEARCPNIGECFNSGTATFMIMGTLCTRHCAFCDVEQGKPKPLDLAEPQKISEAVKILHLKYVVLTSVDP